MIRKFFKAIDVIRAVRNWGVYFDDYLKQLGGKYRQMVFRDGAMFLFRPGTLDRLAITEVCIYNIYNPDGFELKDTDTVVDIGAHIGAFSVYAGKRAMRVLAYEPVPENHKVMEMNLALNGLDNVTSIHGCVGGLNETKRIFLSEDNTCGHSEFHLCGGTRYIDTQSTSLKNILNKIDRIDFLKIDCEGGEHEIILSTSNDVFQKIGKIAMEYHEFDGHYLVSLKNKLEEAGYELTVKEGRGIGMIYARRMIV